MVMVRKANGKWRMCTDYTDLNKLYGCLFRVQSNTMHLEDEEKTAFITNGGAFCYKMMSFGLKNACMTYQRLMDKIFKDVMGKDVEVYVDDMVVKSEKAGDHCKALEQVLGVLRKHQLRLNPEKCSFGVQAGRFLGFMLIERGIEANPDKCQAVIDMRSP
ncbi:Retrovirus-related Pol polyprotein from transposon gypsy, partial [Mucuna pruriens]